MKNIFTIFFAFSALAFSSYICQGAALADLQICREKTLAAAALIKTEGEQAFAKMKDTKGEFWYANGQGYIWVHNLEGIMVMHPAQPALEGQNLLEMRDINGIYLFEAMNKIASNKGQGWVAYSWRKPGEKASSPKVSFVVLADYNSKKYVVGSGLYDFTADDVKVVFPNDAIYEE
jgi:signal transduction histidine kinase